MCEANNYYTIFVTIITMFINMRNIFTEARLRKAFL